MNESYLSYHASVCCTFYLIRQLTQSVRTLYLQIMHLVRRALFALALLRTCIASASVATNGIEVMDVTDTRRQASSVIVSSFAVFITD